MACYVRIGDNVSTEELVEVPTEKDGTLLLSSISAQFPGTVGLRFKTESGSWRGCRIEGNIIDPPAEGWGEADYFVVKQALKRSAAKSDAGPSQKLSKESENTEQLDLIMVELPFSATEDEVRKYFEKYGVLEQCGIKYDSHGTSRGFGFMRYKTNEATKAALNATHIIQNRRVEVRYTKRSQELLMMGGRGGWEDSMPEDNTPTTLFIGRIPKGTTTDDLQEAFSKYGALKDVYIPTPPKGYGFVTFSSTNVAYKVMNETHLLKGQYLNVSAANGKKNQGAPGQQNPGAGNQGNMPAGGGYGNMMGGGNMQMQQWMQNMSGGMQGQNGGATNFGNYGYGFPGCGTAGNYVWRSKPSPKS